METAILDSFTVKKIPKLLYVNNWSSHNISFNDSIIRNNTIFSGKRKNPFYIDFANNESKEFICKTICANIGESIEITIKLHEYFFTNDSHELHIGNYSIMFDEMCLGYFSIPISKDSHIRYSNLSTLRQIYLDGLYFNKKQSTFDEHASNECSNNESQIKIINKSSIDIKYVINYRYCETINVFKMFSRTHENILKHHLHITFSNNMEISTDSLSDFEFEFTDDDILLNGKSIICEDYNIFSIGNTKYLKIKKM